jgi:hypothetical protein
MKANTVLVKDLDGDSGIEFRKLIANLCDTVIENRKESIGYEFRTMEQRRLMDLRKENIEEYRKEVDTFYKCFKFWKMNDERYILIEGAEHLLGKIKTMEYPQ